MVDIQAIIFAAGRGSRLYPYTNEIPKCLLKVGGRTLIERQVSACEDAGIKDIVIITGYMPELIWEAIGDRANYAFNLKFLTTQTLYSFHCSRDLGYGKSQIHIDSDNFFDPSLIQVLADSKESVLLVDEKAKLDDEASKALVANGRVSLIGKQIPGNVEITGLMKLDVKFTNALYDVAKKEAKAGRLSAHVYDGINPLLKRFSLSAKSIGDAYWTEIDFISDLRRARRHSAPKKMLVRPSFQ